MRALASILGLSFVLATAVVATAASSPSEFVSDAIKGDNSEILLGQYAADHGASAATKRFGRVLSADHTKAKDQMSKIAQQLGVTPPTDPMPEAQTELRKLQGLNGTAFDTEFASYMVDDHQKDIAKFAAEAKAKDGAASSMAAQQLPVLRKHLKMAQALQNKKT
jgi:putative membrane protein